MEKKLRMKDSDWEKIYQFLKEHPNVYAGKEEKSRRETRVYDKHLYKERHAVECFIGKIKHYRHIFSRFEKLASRYLGFLSFVGSLIWLR